MKRLSFIVLIILLLMVLSACGKTEAPVPTAAVETPVQELTLAPVEPPAAETAAPVQPETEAPGPVQPPPASPSIDGRELLESRCSACHSVEKVTAQTGTVETWETIVSSMIARGAKLTDEEKTILVQYLAENFK